MKKATGKLSSNVWTYYYTAESRLEAVKKGSTLLMAATYDGDNNRIFDITYMSTSGNADTDSEISKAYSDENGLGLSWKCIDPACHKNHDHENCQILHPKKDEENKAFVKSVLDDTIVVAGEEMLPVKKTSSSYAGYDLTYYLNDVTIDNAEVLVEYGSDGLEKSIYQYGLDRLSVEYGNTVSQYFLYNGTGSVVQTAEENGSLALRYTYDPFGTPSVRSPGVVSLADTPGYTYNGESYNYTTGLQYLRARYYNTSTGSFISQDTYLGDTVTPLSQNRYTYAHNNPVMYDDPSGHWLNVLIGAVAGAAISTVTSVATSVITGEDIDLKKVGVAALTGAASGALMSIGLPTAAVAVGNAVIDMAGNAIEQKIDIDSGKKEKFDVKEMLFEGGVSAASTFLFYDSDTPKHLLSQENNLKKQVLKNGKPFIKASKYFWSQTKDDITKMIAEQFAPREFLRQHRIYRKNIGFKRKTPDK